MAAKALMFQGTGSDVGKSLFVAGLCRLASKKGICVQPVSYTHLTLPTIYSV